MGRSSSAVSLIIFHYVSMTDPIFRTFPPPLPHFQSENLTSTQFIRSRHPHYHLVPRPSTHLRLLCVNRHHFPQEIHHYLPGLYKRLQTRLASRPHLEWEVSNRPVV